MTRVQVFLAVIAAAGTVILASPGNASERRDFLDAGGRFCTDTRSGMELCGIEYYLRKDRLRIFNRAGDMVQEFVVKR